MSARFFPCVQLVECRVFGAHSDRLYRHPVASSGGSIYKNTSRFEMLALHGFALLPSTKKLFRS